MHLNGLTERNHRLEALLTPLSLSDIRREVKQILISTELVSEADFYQREDVGYIPNKLVLKRQLNFKYTFDQSIIARCIFEAHERDKSFEKITQRCKTVLSSAEFNFACMLILASGSGYLTAHLLSGLQRSQLEGINHTVYGVDISQTMNRHGLEVFSRINTQSLQVRYRPVISNCASFDDMSSHILELTQDTPVLTVSHGGVRYFAEGHEELFIKSLATFPENSRFIITEVGHELSGLMDNLAHATASSPNLELLHTSNENDVTWHQCWNLTYYYFLMQQYLQSALLRTYIDTLYDQIYTSETANGVTHDFFTGINFILLEIAGAREQPVYILELRCKRRL
ncbi:MAG: hypothetical protein KDJ52_17845 [Anaerolineae bacterium]|nr:hypothetical protein [Anaerolineae bacterium]